MYKIENGKFYISDETNVNFSELKVGLVVYDTALQLQGYVENCDDWHHVSVRFDSHNFNQYHLLMDNDQICDMVCLIIP